MASSHHYHRTGSSSVENQASIPEKANIISLPKKHSLSDGGSYLTTGHLEQKDQLCAISVHASPSHVQRRSKE
jgi:hypothetical protein